MSWKRPLGIRREPLEEAVHWLADAQLLELGASGELRLHPLIHAFVSRRLNAAWAADKAAQLASTKLIDPAILGVLNESSVTSLEQLFFCLAGISPGSQERLQPFASLLSQAAGEFRKGVSAAAQIFLRPRIDILRVLSSQGGQMYEAL
jgi:hypothetical protein